MTSDCVPWRTAGQHLDSQAWLIQLYLACAGCDGGWQVTHLVITCGLGGGERKGRDGIVSFCWWHWLDLLLGTLEQNTGILLFCELIDQCEITQDQRDLSPHLPLPHSKQGFEAHPYLRLVKLRCFKHVLILYNYNLICGDGTNMRIISESWGCCKLTVNFLQTKKMLIIWAWLKE